jgi:uroporphyrinogen decarboxylase
MKSAFLKSKIENGRVFMTMTKRERVISAIQHRTPDRLPVNDSFWEDTLSRWIKEGLADAVVPREHFDFDIADFSIDASPGFEAKLLSEDNEFFTLQDRFGYVARKTKGKSRTIDYMSYPVPDRDCWATVKHMFMNKQTNERTLIDDIGFPFRFDPEPTWEQAQRKLEAVRTDDYYVLASAYGPHEATWRLHGFTDTLMDIAMDAEFIIEIASTYVDSLIETLQCCKDKGLAPDGFWMIDDVAATRGMLFSPDHWRQIYKPLVQKLGDFLKDAGIHFWMHSCGNCEPIFDDLVECGLQVINPLEAKSGLDVCELKEKYGDTLCFYGNIDVHTMSGDEADCKHEIKRKLSCFNQGGGYIYHSDHSVPPEVSLAHYRKVMEFVRKYGT